MAETFYVPEAEAGGHITSAQTISFIDGRARREIQRWTVWRNDADTHVYEAMPDILDAVDAVADLEATVADLTSRLEALEAGEPAA